MLTTIIMLILITIGFLFDEVESQIVYYGIIIFGFIFIHDSDNQTIEALLAMLVFRQLNWENLKDKKENDE